MRTKFILLLLITLFSTTSNATIVEEQPLGFGEFAIAKNDAVSTLRIRHDGGNQIATYKILPLAFGQPGIFQLSNYPVFTPLMITVSNFVLQLGAAPDLLIEDFTFDPVTTNGNGEATLVIGATLKTTGTGTNYGDGNYTGVMNIVINW